MLWLALASCTSHKNVYGLQELQLQKTEASQWYLSDTLFLNTQLAPMLMPGYAGDTSIKVGKNLDPGLTAASNTPQSPLYVPLAIRHTTLNHQDTTRSTTASHWQQTQEKTPVSTHRLDMTILLLIILMLLCGFVSLVILVSTKTRRH